MTVPPYCSDPAAHPVMCRCLPPDILDRTRDATAGDELREAIARDVARLLYRYSGHAEDSLMGIAREFVAESFALRDVLAERDRLREFAEWVLSLTDDPPHRRTVTLEQIIQRAALACDPDLGDTA